MPVEVGSATGCLVVFAGAYVISCIRKVVFEIIEQDRKKLRQL